MFGPAEMLKNLRGPGVDTRRTPRRAIEIRSIEEVVAEIDQIEAASHQARETNDASGGSSLWVSGNWSVGQIFQHIAITIERSLDGFGDLPLSDQFRAKGVRHAVLYPVRAKARERESLVKSMLVERVHEPGGSSVAFNGQLEPSIQVWTVDGAARLRQAIGRILQGQTMGHASPAMGRMTHEEWLRYHLRHVALHLSFVHR